MRRSIAILGLLGALALVQVLGGPGHRPVRGVECPDGVSCRFVPAAYAWNDHADPNDYGNYDPADRPADGNRIRFVVIHDTEISYDATIAGISHLHWPLPPIESTRVRIGIRPEPGVAKEPFPGDCGPPAAAPGRPAYPYKSTHYVIRSRDGAITQMVPTSDIAWHAANSNVNQEGIGIEHEGVASEGRAWYREAMYRSSAALVRYLARRDGIPLDRAHVLGHDEVPPRGPAQVARMHWDPGPYWDWNHYMALLGAAPRTEQGPVAVGDVVTISPDFAADRQALVTDSPPPCHARPVQGTNFTFLRVAPVGTAPLLSDPALHSGPGTRAVEDWSDKAVAGRQYVVAAVRGGWVAIWYAGKQAWIDDPGHRIVRRSRAQPRKVTPAAGRDWIPVYGEAFPAADEYPAGIAPDVVHPLPYKMLRGQQYVVGEVTRASRYYARFDDAGVPGNHTLVRGSQVYLDISFNHRWAFVRLSDVRNA